MTTEHSLVSSIMQAQTDVCEDVPANLPEILAITLNRTEGHAKVQLKTVFPVSGWQFELKNGLGYTIPLSEKHNKFYPDSPFKTEHTQRNSVHTFSLLNRQASTKTASLEFYDINFRVCFSLCGKSCYEFLIQGSYPTVNFIPVKLLEAPNTNTVVDPNGKTETKTVIRTDSDQIEALEQDLVEARYSETMNSLEQAANYIKRTETIQNLTNLLSIQVQADLPNTVFAIGRVEVFQLTDFPLPLIFFTHRVEYRKPDVTLPPLLKIEACNTIYFNGTGTKSTFVDNVLKIETNVGEIQCLRIVTSGEPETRVRVLRMDTIQEQVHEAQGTVFNELEVYIEPLEEHEERMYMVTAENEHGSVTKLAVFSPFE